jgi:hypothetical protein
MQVWLLLVRVWPAPAGLSEVRFSIGRAWLLKVFLLQVVG